MITVFTLMLLTIAIVLLGFLIGIIALFVVNWGPGAAYDNTTKVRKPKEIRRFRRK